MNTLQQTINWAKTFIQYSPITAGFGQEPAVSTATIIRSTLLNAPMTWYWNRAELTFNTVKGTQDYTESVPAFGFVEKVTLTDVNGKIWEIKDVYNTAALAKSSDQQRPEAMSVEGTSSGSLIFRFLGVPNAIYAVTVIYQQKAQAFGPFLVASVANHVSTTTTYTGVFDALSFPTGSTASITGFTTPANNGSFVVVSCSGTSLVVTSSAGVAETPVGGAFASCFNWSPIPDTFIDIYNNLFLSEMMTNVDDAKSQVYRQRGIAAFLAKAQGLTETQRNAFVQQWLNIGVESTTTMLKAQTGVQARGV